MADIFTSLVSSYHMVITINYLYIQQTTSKPGYDICYVIALIPSKYVFFLKLRCVKYQINFKGLSQDFLDPHLFTLGFASINRLRNALTAQPFVPSLMLSYLASACTRGFSFADWFYIKKVPSAERLKHI